ncbi:unnamed protein product [Trichobilharzia szidati]|nr:unnamed protein product [Trichobilharzia szidati]
MDTPLSGSQETERIYLPLWAWCYLTITGILFAFVLTALCYTRKWLCFRHLVQRRWCRKNADSIQKGIYGYEKQVNSTDTREKESR